MNRIKSYLFKSTDARNLSIFRILFGLVMLWEQSRLYWQGMGYSRYINTVFHFKYNGFEWVKQLPDEMMYFIFALSILVSVTFTLGYFFRVSSIILFITYTYMFLLDLSYWNNHYYFFVFILLLFSLTNSHQMYSLDVKRKSFVSNQIPNWQVFLFKFLIAVPLIYGALSKIMNPDWFSNLSMTHILNNSLDRHEITLSDTIFKYATWIMTIGGFLYDLLIIPILLWRRTFWLGVVLSLLFNLSNHFFLNIGSFPWAMIGTLFIFYRFKPIDSLVPVIPNSNKVLVFVSIFVGFHVLMPFRHLLIEGQVLWTGEGKVGAWHMMSGSTVVERPTFLLVEKDEFGNVIANNVLDPDVFLNQKQLRTLGKWPRCVPEFAKWLTVQARHHEMENLTIFCDIRVGRNGRTPVPIISISQDLTNVERNFFSHNEYILLYLDQGY